MNKQGKKVKATTKTTKVAKRGKESSDTEYTDKSVDRLQKAIAKKLASSEKASKTTTPKTKKRLVVGEST